MADKEAKPQVMLADVTMKRVWDDKACKEVPGWAADAMKKALGRAVEIVSSKPKEGFILTPAIEPIDFDEAKGMLSGAMSVLVTDARKSVKASLSTKGSLKGVEAKNLQKNLQRLIGSMATKCGGDAADEIVAASKAK